MRDVTVVTGLTGGSTGAVRYTVEAEEADGLAVRVAQRDAGGGEVVRATGASGELTVEDVHPCGRARATCTSCPSSWGMGGHTR